MNKMVSVLWSILSLIVSGLFIFHGLMILQLEELPVIPLLTALVALGYGLITVYVLSQSWINPNHKLVTFTKYIVISMFIVQVALNLDVGMVSGLEWAGLLVVAVMLATNWLSVKYVVNYKKA